MIRVINYISAIALRQFAQIVARLKPSFKTKLNIIESSIVNANCQSLKIPNNLIHSIIAIEDKRYYKHYGIDTYSVVRAFYKNITTKRIEGASTITQQLIRNITNDREVNFTRKTNEILLATIISNEFSKDELLFAYLNTYKFFNCIGIYSLCSTEKYNIENLSNNEAAQIAARFKYPSINKNNYVKYLKRVRTIEKKLHITAHLQ